MFSRIDNTYQNAGATAQLQSTLFGRLHLLTALRVAWIDIHSEEAAITPARKYDSSSTNFLPRVGLSYDVTDWLSVYGSYAEGAASGDLLQRRRRRAAETRGLGAMGGGVKLDGLYGLSGTLAWFDLRRTNVVLTPPGSLTQRQSGEWRSSGVELDLVWQPLDNVSVLASFAHVDAKVARDENPQLQNARLNLSPRDSGRLWANYTFDGALLNGALKGWSAGAGFYAASGQVVEIGQPTPLAQIGKPWSTSGYITFDANVAYRRDNFTFAITGKNLGDQRYFVQYPYLQGRVAPGEGRTFFATVSVRM